MDRQAGFTLAETLAALMVFAIAALAMLHLSAENTRAAGAARDHALAGLVAGNAMAEALTAPAAPAMASGVAPMGGADWAWRRVVAATGEPGLIRIDIEVRAEAEDGAERLAASLTGFRSVRE